MDLALLLLADGRFPAGGHAYSAGTESAVRYGDVTDIGSLERFLAGRLATVGAVDAAFATRTCAASTVRPPLRTLWQDKCTNRALFLPQAPGPKFAAGQVHESRTIPATGFEAVVDELDAEYGVRVVSARARAVSRQLGRQMLRAARGVWPRPWLVGELHQPVALGLAVAAAGGAPEDAGALAFHHLASAVTTAAVRMLGIDPLAAASVHASAVAGMQVAPEWATCSPADLPALGSSLAEILAEDHGQWDARMFVA